MDVTKAMPIPFVAAPAGNAARTLARNCVARLRRFFPSPRQEEEWLPSSPHCLRDIGMSPERGSKAPSWERDWVLWR